MHSKHPLYLNDYHKTRGYGWCDLCGRVLGEFLGYECSICGFVIDVACEKIGLDALLEERSELQHPSHPNHSLTLMRKSAFAFYCDGCGTHDVDMAYICSICEFWIHKACALLPLTLPTNLHHHKLSLTFSIPMEHRKHGYDCDVCHKKFDATCWVYFCDDCRFCVHLRCAASTETKDSNLEEEDGSDVIQFPIHGHDIAKKLITPFVMREKGLNKMPNVKDMSENKSASFPTLIYNYHKHPLSLVLKSLEDHSEISNDEDKDEDEERDELKICDFCVTPISSPPYYNCAFGKFSIHSICYLLPKTLSSSSSSSSSNNSTHHPYTDCPSAHNKTHKFTLYTSSAVSSREMDYTPYDCGICQLLITNGTAYECEWCEKKIDVKCASLPTTIRHSSHPHHKPLIMTRIPEEGVKKWKMCRGCGGLLYDCVAYCCSSDDCDFALDSICAQLPPSIIMREWDKHPLPLTYDASLDHPDDFICGFCEEEVVPKLWMYHCRPCDNSFHVFCLGTASGPYRNIKFGQRVLMTNRIRHPHPLTFTCVTVVKRCGNCRREVYDTLGFECASCYFAICLICSSTP